MLEAAIVEHASPTLAGLKAGCLFNFPAAPGEIADELSRIGAIFEGKGCGIALMRCAMGRSLIFVYRRRDIARVLGDARCAAFLAERGYRELTVEGALSALRERLSVKGRFPHEIGLFLGYPIEDVEGFIENRGGRCRLCGCWKVYTNECEARRRFSKFKKCKEVYSWLYKTGMSIEKLTVSA